MSNGYYYAMHPNTIVAGRAAQTWRPHLLYLHRPAVALAYLRKFSCGSDSVIPSFASLTQIIAYVHNSNPSPNIHL